MPHTCNRGEVFRLENLGHEWVVREGFAHERVIVPPITLLPSNLLQFRLQCDLGEVGSRLRLLSKIETCAYFHPLKLLLLHLLVLVEHVGVFMENYLRPSLPKRGVAEILFLFAFMARDIVAN